MKKTYDRLLSAIFMPLSIMTIIHRLYFFPHNPNNAPPPDFYAVYLSVRRFVKGQAVYVDEVIDSKVPYMYSPGGTLLLSPFGFFEDVEPGKLLSITLNGVGLILGTFLLTRAMKIRSFSGLFWFSLFLVFLSVSARDSIAMGNVNGILFLPFCGFLVLLTGDRKLYKQIIAGIAVGLCVVLKPLFLPLLILFVFRRFWWSIVSGFITFAAINSIGWAMMVDPDQYIERVFPLMQQARPYSNQAFAGIGQFYNFSDTSVTILRGLTIVLVGVAFLVLLRWLNSDPLFFVFTASGIILAGVFLASNLGQGYYSLFLFPLILTAMSQTRTVMLNPVMWVGVFIVSAPAHWFTPEGKYSPVIYNLPGYIYTLGWSILVLVGTITILFMYVRDRDSSVSAESDSTTAYGVEEAIRYSTPSGQSSDENLGEEAPAVSVGRHARRG